MASHRYSTILFDFDGCIANTLPIWLKSFRKTFNSLNVEISDRDIIDNAFHRWDAKPELKIPDLEFFKNDLYANFHQYSQKLQTHEGFIEIATTLRSSGIKTAVVTSTLRRTINAMLKDLSCEKLFDTTLAWEDTIKNKPDPEPLLKAMERLGVRPDETIMIGDNEVDIIAAQQAQVTSIWYYPEVNEYFYPENKFAHHKPHFTIKHFQELFEIL